MGDVQVRTDARFLFLLFHLPPSNQAIGLKFWRRLKLLFCERKSFFVSIGLFTSSISLTMSPVRNPFSDADSERSPSLQGLDLNTLEVTDRSIFASSSGIDSYLRVLLRFRLTCGLVITNAKDLRVRPFLFQLPYSLSDCWLRAKSRMRLVTARSSYGAHSVLGRLQCYLLGERLWHSIAGHG